MALFRCQSGNGGGSKSANGTFNSTGDGVDHKITLDFRPKQLCLYYIPSLSSNSPSVVAVYDDDMMNGSSYWRALNNNGTIQCQKNALPNNNPLKAIHDDGFTYNLNGFTGTWYYFAVG